MREGLLLGITQPKIVMQAVQQQVSTVHTSIVLCFQNEWIMYITNSLMQKWQVAGIYNVAPIDSFMFAPFLSLKEYVIFFRVSSMNGVQK